MSLTKITDDLVMAVSKLEFGAPVTHVYNPLDYARAGWDAYCDRFGASPKKVLFLGMNPGPWGMAQTGVPFGEVAAVRDWMGLKFHVAFPVPEHPKRPVSGLACPRAEVSGARLWGWARELFGTPETFFDEAFVLNYCPLVFMEESGRNHTPEKLPSVERVPLENACNEALRQTVAYFDPEYVIGIGKFAMDRAKLALGESNRRIETIPHPSPANPAANRGWSALANKALGEIGLWV